MGAFYLRDNIQGIPSVEGINVQNNTEITFSYSQNGTSIDAKCYCPTRDDYEVSIEVVDRAIQNGYNVIAYDSWIFPTIASTNYALTQGIKVYSATDLIRKLRKGEEI